MNLPKSLPTSLITIAGDLLPVVTGIPLGNTFAESVNRLIDGRRRKAREILMDELSQGQALIESVSEVDELAAIFLRYIRAAEEGTARLNLRLMAMTIRGMSHKGTLTANRFLYYTGFLATLTREEVIATATLYKNEERSTGRDDTRKRGTRPSAGSHERGTCPGLFPHRAPSHLYTSGSHSYGPRRRGVGMGEAWL
jgi:hypothetical protein